MRIAILGATSQIARDLAPRLLGQGHALALFARDPSRLAPWLARMGAPCSTGAFEDFPAGSFDAVLNCVGVGDPARAAAMGAEILEITRTYDALALAYLRRHSGCRYIFLSSGAAYGGSFDRPADASTPARFPLNDLKPEHWYGLAKFSAECAHRAHGDLAIVDLRVFSYFSHTQNLDSRFLVADMLRAIQRQEPLRTSADFMVRDFIHPSDLHRLVEVALAAPALNTAWDVYSRAPVEKPVLLQAMQQNFGLRYETVAGPVGVNATGAKPHYYSLDRRAAAFGYAPGLDALEGLLQEAALALSAGQGEEARAV